MTYDKLNEYILNYLENDKTNSAIMLTGGWGTGKSYYIEHTLKSFLEEKDHECVVVSLYGLKHISEISKTIFVESRLKKFNLKGEKAKAGIIAGKTLVKGLAGVINIDLTQDNSDWQALYESINLTNKLIVLEDVERTSIDIIELLGFVNNLVEHDSVKLLLVTNESEFAKKVIVDEKIDNEGNKPIWEYTEESKIYLSYKEKTVNDTIIFEPDIRATIYSIIDYFGSDYLNRFKTEQFCEDVKFIFFMHKSVNFRTFIFATQKFLDILKFINREKYPYDFIDRIYYSIISFSILFKSNPDIKWEGNDNYSLQMGLHAYPLYKSFYDYIVNQNSDFSKIDEYYKDYLNLFSHKEIINTFENYYLLPEIRVTESLMELYGKLEKNEISIGIYPRLLSFLVKFENKLGYDIKPIIQSMIKNVKGKIDKLGGRNAFDFNIYIEDKTLIPRFTEITNLLIESANSNDEYYGKWFNSVEDVKNDCEVIRKLYTGRLKNNSFMSLIDTEKTAMLFLKCDSEQMTKIRSVFKTIYEEIYPNYDQSKEKDNLQELSVYLKNADYSKLDSIQILHIQWFVKQIEGYIEKFNVAIECG